MEYFTILTRKGMSKIKESLTNDSQIILNNIAIGDGNGIIPIPTEEVSCLLNEKYRGNINLVDAPIGFPQLIVIEAIIPREIGGFYVREVGVLDKDGDLIAYGNHPETYKIKSTNSNSELYIQILMQVSNRSSITLNVSGTVLASRDYVDSMIVKHEDSGTHKLASTTTNGFMNSTDKSKLDLLLKGVSINSIPMELSNSYLNLIESGNCNLRVDANSLIIHSNTDSLTLQGKEASDFVSVSHIGSGGNAHSVASKTNAGFLSNVDKSKLDTVSEGAEENLPSYNRIKIGKDLLVPKYKIDTLELKAGTGIALEADTSLDSITINSSVSADGGNADMVDGRHASDFVPVSHIGSGGNAHSEASLTKAGFMSIDQVDKLNTITRGAQINQNAFAKIKVKEFYILADQVQDEFELEAGAGIDVEYVPGILGDKIKISNTVLSTPSSHAGTRGIGTLTHLEVTDTEGGFMTPSDKIKLDSIATGAQINQNAYSNIKVNDQDIPATIASDSFKFNFGSNIDYSIIDKELSLNVIDVDTVDGLHASDFTPIAHAGTRGISDLTHLEVTDTEGGFMTPSDKIKLDSIEEGAQANKDCFSFVTINLETIAALTPTDTLNIEVGEGFIYSMDDRKITLDIDLTEISHHSINGLLDDDHPQYIMADGTRAFTGKVSGVDPTEASNLTTKNYVDNRSMVILVQETEPVDPSPGMLWINPSI